MTYKEKIVLVAGGTGALGSAVSLAFLSEGAELIVTYRNDREFAKLTSAAGANASKLTGRQIDVTDQAAVQQLTAQIVAQHRRLDVLVNTVGGYIGGSALWDLKPGEFDRMLELNLRSGYVLSSAVVKVMLQQKEGAIVNVASRAALEPGAGMAAYAASKAAAVAMMDSLAADLKGTGVRVNSILPSIIDTEANRSAMPAANFADWAKPEDIARVILFLCGNDAKVIHGASIPV